MAELPPPKELTLEGSSRSPRMRRLNWQPAPEALPSLRGPQGRPRMDQKRRSPQERPQTRQPELAVVEAPCRARRC